MAKVIIGGQALSLLLTLLVTPVAYALWDDFTIWFNRLIGNQPREDRREQPRGEGHEPEPAAVDSEPIIVTEPVGAPHFVATTPTVGAK